MATKKAPKDTEKFFVVDAREILSSFATFAEAAQEALQVYKENPDPENPVFIYERVARVVSEAPRVIPEG